MGFPSYPEESLAVSATAEEDTASLRKEKAARLLGTKSAVSYTRSEGDSKIYGYRTASAFAEFNEDAELLRFLCASPHELPAPADAAETARQFLVDHGLGEAVLQSEKAVDNTALFTFSFGGTEGLLGICHTGVYLFQRMVTAA